MRYRYLLLLFCLLVSSLFSIRCSGIKVDNEAFNNEKIEEEIYVLINDADVLRTAILPKAKSVEQLILENIDFTEKYAAKYGPENPIILRDIERKKIFLEKMRIDYVYALSTESTNYIIFRLLTHQYQFEDLSRLESDIRRSNKLLAQFNSNLTDTEDLFNEIKNDLK